MKIINDLKDFLEDKEYYIDIFDNKIHVFNYLKLIKIDDKKINLKFEKFILEIEGSDLKVNEMNNKEMLISGILNGMRFKR